MKKIVILFCLKLFLISNCSGQSSHSSGIYSGSTQYAEHNYNAYVSFNNNTLSGAYIDMIIFDGKIHGVTTYFYSNKINNEVKIKVKTVFISDISKPQTTKSIVLKKDKITIDDVFIDLKLEKRQSWVEIRVVRNKCFLFKNNNELTKQKSYLVEGDIVEVIEKKENWLKIEYINDDTEKSIKMWIKETDLYPIDPAQWK